MALAPLPGHFSGIEPARDPSNAGMGACGAAWLQVFIMLNKESTQAGGHMGGASLQPQKTAWKERNGGENPPFQVQAALGVSPAPAPPGGPRTGLCQQLSSRTAPASAPALSHRAEGARAPLRQGPGHPGAGGKSPGRALSSCHKRRTRVLPYTTLHKLLILQYFCTYPELRLAKGGRHWPSPLQH